MPKHLKTLYPCRDCGTPTQVRSRRDVEHAKCLRCVDRDHAAMRWGFAEREAHDAAKKGNAASERGDTSAALMYWLFAVAHWTEAAARRLERKSWQGYPVTQAEFTPAERRALATRAVSNMRHARECLEQLEAWGAEVLHGERGLGVVAGGGEGGEAPRRLTLRLHADGKPPRVVFMGEESES